MGSSNQFRGGMYALTAGVMWALLSIALKITLNRYTLSPFTIVWFRFSIAFCILGAILYFKHPDYFRVFYKPPWKLIGATLCLGFNYYGYMRGLDYTTPSNAQVFTQIGPVLFAIAGIILFRERITWLHVVGFLVVILGFMLFYWEQIGAMANQQNYSLGIVWIVVSSAMWVFYAIWQKELAQTYSTNQLNLFIYGGCSLIFLPGIHLGGFAGLDLPGWGLVLFLGLNTLIAYGAIAKAFQYLDSNNVSVIITMSPILTFGIMYLFMVLHIHLLAYEHFSLLSMTGAITALSGSVLVIVFARKKKTS